MGSLVVVVLGAGRPYRGSSPSILQHVSHRRRVLEWIRHAFTETQAGFHYVGGYGFDEFTRNVDTIEVTYNPDWKSTGSLVSFFHVPVDPACEYVVCYSDIVFRRKAVTSLLGTKGDVVLAIDSQWQARYDSRTSEDLRAAEKVLLDGPRVVDIGRHIAIDQAEGEFIGLVRFTPRAMRLVSELRSTASHELRQAHLPELFGKLLKAGLELNFIDVVGEWAELNAPQDIARFILGTKAETLERLRPLVRKSTINDQVRFTAQQWSDARRLCLELVHDRFGSTRVVVRSSARAEDSWLETKAGAFLSLLDVPISDEVQLADAIDRVIGSYDGADSTDQVLIQEYLTDVHSSGVVFTRSLSYGAPYYVVNYDDVTRSTETVTSGSGVQLKTLLMHRDAAGLPNETPDWVHQLIAAIRELEELVGHDCLDIEFATLETGAVHILQVRPMAVDHAAWRGTDEAVGRIIDLAAGRFRALQLPLPFVLGQRAVFGVMPDWNPAEIIGTRPRQLATSLYRYLVTDDVWAQARAQCGYRDVRPQPLMVLLAGQPFIDIRASFNSFIPSSVSDPTAKKIVDHYLQRLEDNPHLHDKIEFEIAFTCLTFDFDESVTRLSDEGFRREEIDELKDGLRNVTMQAFARNEADMNDIRHLEQRLDRVLATDSPAIDQAFVLLDDCKRFGCLPFSRLARSAFVAVALLRSLASAGIMDQANVSSYLNSLSTVAKTLTRDAEAVSQGAIRFEEFVRKYGHLRPGTYEITVSPYAADPEKYLRSLVRQATGERHDDTQDSFAWSSGLRKSISRALASIGLPDDIDAFDAFVRQSIEGREFAKFVFTKNLSLALRALEVFGTAHGLTPEHLSYLPLENFELVRSGQKTANLAGWLKALSEKEREAHETSLGIELPALLFDESDFRSFFHSEARPNYIGRGKVTADIVEASSDDFDRGSLKRKIIAIPQADPGYDWLFGHKIAGLITAYGGANSHMAIRAAEFGLPAAIGVGDSAYDAISRARRVRLDCENRRIEVIH